MEKLPKILLFLSVSFGVLFLLLVWSAVKRKIFRIRRPVTERLLRSPGESLKTELGKLNERFSEVAAVISLFPVVFVLLFEKFPLGISMPIYGIFLTPVIGCLIYWQRRYMRVDLGWSGERAVGEELNKLMFNGYYVYHDFPKSNKSNIDHIIIGPSGIYVVETKTRRKKKAWNGQGEHKIIYDGQVLQFPNGYDDRALRQVRENAAYLSDVLSKALAERIAVTPILTFPGWFIELKAKPPFLIVNPKQIPRLVASRSAVLSKEQIERARFQVEEKCRDVEF
jgi:hypothetical protein